MFHVTSGLMLRPECSGSHHVHLEVVILLPLVTNTDTRNTRYETAYGVIYSTAVYTPNLL